MGDSDDEFERKKGRDKFRRERNDYDRRSDDRRRDSWDDRRPMRGGQGGGGMRNRDMWSSRGSGPRDRRDMYSRPYDDRRRDRFSPGRYDNPHPAKRMRRDWDDGGYGGGMYDGPFQVRDGPPPDRWRGPMESRDGPPGRNNGPPGPPGFDDRRDAPECDYPTQPPMMTFKQFLNKQDDSISQEDAIKAFEQYKLEFKKQQITDFFLAHKNEEWFKGKYHPEETSKREVEVKTNLEARRKVFATLLEKNFLDGIVVDVDTVDPLVKVMDAGVILLEGGNDLDLTILDAPPEESGDNRSRQNSESVPNATPKEEDKKDEVSEEKDKDTEKNPENKTNGLEMEITPEQEELKKQALEYQKQQEAAVAAEEKAQHRKKKSMRKKNDYSYESDSNSGSGSDSDPDSDPEPAPPGLEDEVPPPPPGTEDPKQETKEEEGEVTESGDASKPPGDGEIKQESTGDNKEAEVPEEPKPRPLHRTNSIFLRNLAPTITKQEVEALCRRYPGFKRVALQDPQPERRFFRRGWVTFTKDSNIKEVCWHLNNIRLRDCELGATLNRDLRQRIRPANGLTVHKQVMRNDIKMAAKIIQVMDKRVGLWEEGGQEKKDEEKEPQFGFVSNNPVLNNITDFLVEEGSFEEEELLGASEEDKKDGDTEISIEKDDSLAKALDRMIMYLRLVHSVDYYSANEYPNEDEMPHRCGIMHARGTPPGTSAKVTQTDVNEWMSSFETKIKPFLDANQKIAETEANQLGKKDPDAEVEKFVQANTQELSRDKWLCPLSGKKFKGPDFVRKHIFNKHQEKVEEVKKEVEFFNNYLQDPKRPALPEHPSSRPKPPPPPAATAPTPPQRQDQGYPMGGPGGYGGQGRPPMYGGGGYQNPFMVRDHPPDFPPRHNFGNRPFRRSDPRPLIKYTDLDAPDDSDIF